MPLNAEEKEHYYYYYYNLYLILYYTIQQIYHNSYLISSHTCHAMTLHASHFVLSFQRGQQSSANGDAVHHGTEL